MKHLSLLVCAILPLCISTGVWAWSPLDVSINKSGIILECYTATAASDDSGADESTDESEEEEEPDCD